MARHKNICWNVDTSPTWEQVRAAVLMDIRDELQQLNRTFSCENIGDMRRILVAIRRNTAKRKCKR